MSGSSPSPGKGKKPKEALWLMSFSDMTLTLMCFFLLMMSTMQPNVEKMQHIKDGLISQEKIKRMESVKAVSEQMESYIKEHRLESQMEVNYGAEGLEIALQNQLVFESGSASLNSNFNRSAGKIMKMIAQLGERYDILIEGHTDDVPLIGSARFLSNWELSAARGFAMMRRLQQYGVVEEHLSVQAYAHTRPKVDYKHLAGKDLEAARSKNRRVVLRVL